MLGIDVGDEAAGMPLGDKMSVVVGETVCGVVVWDMVERLSCVVQTSTVVAKSVLGLDDRDEDVGVSLVV